jgi:hypothetical protein
MAAGAFGLAAVVMVATVGFARTSVPVAAARAPNAGSDLEQLMRAGELGSWSVTYQFTRTLADGRVLREAMQEARVPALHVLRSGSAMTIDKGERSYDCNLVRAEFACTESGTGPTLAPSEVLRVAVSVGAYHVTETSTTTIAGEPARCFRVLGHGQLLDLGLETDLCVTATGIPVRQRVMYASGVVDERVAQTIATRVTARTIEAIVGDVDPSRATGQQ